MFRWPNYFLAFYLTDLYDVDERNDVNNLFETNTLFHYASEFVVRR